MSSSGRRATIYDVAAAAGVSKSLVSLVLQGSPKVSSERRAAVEHAMSELGYRPSPAATALAGRRTRTVGVVVDDFRNLWFVDLLDGMREVLEPLGLTTTVADGASDDAGGARAVAEFVAAKTDAIVIACEPWGPDGGDESADAGSGTPVIVAGNRRVRVPGATVIASDDTVGAGAATRHLIELGHTRIGHLAGDGGSSTLRQAAYEATMRAARLAPTVRRGGGGTNEPDGFQAARILLAEAPETTAIFAANDTMALGALAAIHDAGLRVPHDVSLIGYDDSPLAASQILRLTTVDDHSRDVGRAVARNIRAVLAGDDPGDAPRILPSLVVRSSTAPPRPAPS